MYCFSLSESRYKKSLDLDTLTILLGAKDCAHKNMNEYGILHCGTKFI